MAPEKKRYKFLKHTAKDYSNHPADFPPQLWFSRATGQLPKMSWEAAKAAQRLQYGRLST